MNQGGAANLDITINQGADFSLELQFDDSTNTPIDVSSWVFSGQIRAQYDASTVIAAFSFSLGIQSNIVFANLSNSQTTAIPINPSSSIVPATGNTPQSPPEAPPTIYIYDIKAQQAPAMTVVRVIQGNALVYPEVTMP
jgi:hypothetical protein